MRRQAHIVLGKPCSSASRHARRTFKIDPPTGTLISFATRPGSVADDGADGANGLYTSFLLKHIDTANLPVESFFKRVSNDVYTVSKGRQEPWVEGNIRGDFTFNQR